MTRLREWCRTNRQLRAEIADLESRLEQAQTVVSIFERQLAQTRRRLNVQRALTGSWMWAAYRARGSAVEPWEEA